VVAFGHADGSEYVIVASLSGEFLDANANQARTNLEASEDEIIEIVDKAVSSYLRPKSNNTSE